MDNKKIRLRNLDPEVLDYFKKSEDKISFDDLSSSVVEEIKTDASAGLAYNDAELRSRIAHIEDAYVKTIDGDLKYALKIDTYNKAEVEEKFAIVNDDINDRLSGKLSVSDAESGFVKKSANVITENMLSTDLQNKVNARYENKRPEDGSGSEVSISEFNMLKVAVNTNSSNIDNILASYVTKSSIIPKSQLDSETKNILDTARTSNIKIQEQDLEEKLVTKINSSGGGSSSTDTLVYELINSFRGEYGQLFYAKTDDDGNTKIIPRYIYAEEVLLVSKPSELATAKSYSLSHDYDYVGDITNNELLYYSDDQNWEVYAEETLFEYILGRFALDYSSNNIYYGSDETGCKIFIDTSIYEPKTAHQADIESVNADIQELADELSNFKNTQASEKAVIESELSGINTSMTELSTKLEQLNGTVTSNKSDADSSIAAINSSISTLSDSIADINSTLLSISAEITDIKARLTALEPEAAT